MATELKINHEFDAESMPGYLIETYFLQSGMQYRIVWEGEREVSRESWMMPRAGGMGITAKTKAFPRGVKAARRRVEIADEAARQPRAVSAVNAAKLREDRKAVRALLKSRGADDLIPMILGR